MSTGAYAPSPPPLRPTPAGHVATQARLAVEALAPWALDALGEGARLLRVAAREQLPMGLRIAWRRLPAAVAWALSPPEGAAVAPLPFEHLQGRRESPLRRPGTTYDARLQGAKEANVRRAAALLDGAVVAPGEVFSWHRRVGPPLRIRGFQPGPELHDGQLAAGVGGGACQVANLTYWLALTAGMAIVERHRHGLDLFPDDARDVPFGCGATVFHPHRDLKFTNPLPIPLQLRFAVVGDALIGEARFPLDPGLRFELVETHHRFFRAEGGIWRESRLARRRISAEGSLLEPVAVNRARVCYPVPEELLSLSGGGPRDRRRAGLDPHAHRGEP